MTIVDVAETDWAAGRYVLAVYCGGTGSLSASFQIGSSVASTPLIECTPEITLGTVSVDVPDDSEGMEVRIVPSDGAEAAVAYVVTEE